MDGQKLNIDNEAINYLRCKNKNSELELKVITALNENKFTLGGCRDVYQSVYGFFYAMNEQRKKKLGFFNFLYKSSFKDAFESITETDNKKFIEALLDKKKQASSDSILQKMDAEKIKKNLEQYNNDHHTTEVKVDNEEEFEKGYKAIYNTWKLLVSYTNSPRMLFEEMGARAVIAYDLQSFKYKKIENILNGLQNKLKKLSENQSDYYQAAKQLEDPIKAEFEKIVNAKDKTEKEKIIKELYETYKEYMES